MAKVFIVEDEVDICETYSDILEAAGHSVDFVDRASKAYTWLAKANPDVVILDMQLPGESGMLVASFIRRLSRLARAKIVIISGYPELAKTAMSTYGADLFLNKPVTADQLRTTIRNLSSTPVS